ncbi:hypothetical protein ACOSP7_023490 [Xanthoceras sorbifolium]
MKASDDSSSEVNGGLIKFKNRKCACCQRVTVQISESKTNPFKLYFYCERGTCKNYSFWHTDEDEYRISEDVVDKNSDIIKNMQEDIKYVIAIIDTMGKIYQRQENNISVIK